MVVLIDGSRAGFDPECSVNAKSYLSAEASAFNARRCRQRNARAVLRIDFPNGDEAGLMTSTVRSCGVCSG